MGTDSPVPTQQSLRAQDIITNKNIVMSGEGYMALRGFLSHFYVMYRCESWTIKKACVLRSRAPTRPGAQALRRERLPQRETRGLQLESSPGSHEDTAQRKLNRVQSLKKNINSGICHSPGGAFNTECCPGAETGQ